jgi:hypothetical protein
MPEITLTALIGMRADVNTVFVKRDREYDRSAGYTLRP